MAGHDLMKHWLREIWTSENGDAIRDLMAPDAKIYGLEELDIDGVRAFTSYFKLIVSQFTGFRFAVLHEVCAGEWVSGVYVVTCRRRSDGREASARMHVMARFVDGRLLEGYNLIDFVSLFEQAGMLPPRTLDFLLMGQRPAF